METSLKYVVTMLLNSGWMVYTIVYICANCVPFNDSCYCVLACSDTDIVGLKCMGRTLAGWNQPLWRSDEALHTTTFLHLSCLGYLLGLTQQPCQGGQRSEDYFYGKIASKANVGKKYDVTALTTKEQEGRMKEGHKQSSSLVLYLLHETKALKGPLLRPEFMLEWWKHIIMLALLHQRVVSDRAESLLENNCYNAL